VELFVVLRSPQFSDDHAPTQPAIEIDVAGQEDGIGGRQDVGVCNRNATEKSGRRTGEQVANLLTVHKPCQADHMLVLAACMSKLCQCGNAVNLNNLARCPVLESLS